MGRRVLALLAAAVVVAAVANAVSPRGITWTDPLGKSLRARVAIEGLVPVDLDRVRARIRDRSATIVDARPAEEFENGELPGAILVPWKEIDEGREAALRLPSKDRPVLLYCGNEFCEDSLRLGIWMRDRGWREVEVFVDGYEAWWNDGGR